jgi:hypothetical protein
MVAFRLAIINATPLGREGREAVKLAGEPSATLSSVIFVTGTRRAVPVSNLRDVVKLTRDSGESADATVQSII